MESEISKWLETSGGLLELQTARAFQKCGFSVSQGYHFEDPQTGKMREADLLVFGQRHCRCSEGKLLTIAVTFMVECKRSNEKPWLGLISNNGGASSEPYSLPFHMMLSPSAKESIAQLMSQNMESGQPLFKFGKSAYAISTVHINSKGKEHSNGAYSASQQVLDASIFRYKESIKENDALRAHIIIPVIMFDGRLFSATDGAGFGPPDIGEVDEIDLSLRNRFLENKSDAFIKIVSAKKMVSFATRAAKFMDWLENLGVRHLEAKNRK